MTDIFNLFNSVALGDGKKSFGTIVKFANMFWYSKDILQAGITSGFSTADPERTNKNVQEAYANTNMHPKDILAQVT